MTCLNERDGQGNCVCCWCKISYGGDVRLSAPMLKRLRHAAIDAGMSPDDLAEELLKFLLNPEMVGVVGSSPANTENYVFVRALDYWARLRRAAYNAVNTQLRVSALRISDGLNSGGPHPLDRQ